MSKQSGPRSKPLPEPCRRQVAGLERQQQAHADMQRQMADTGKARGRRHMQRVKGGA